MYSKQGMLTSTLSNATQHEDLEDRIWLYLCVSCIAFHQLVFRICNQYKSNALCHYVNPALLVKVSCRSLVELSLQFHFICSYKLKCTFYYFSLTQVTIGVRRNVVLQVCLGRPFNCKRREGLVCIGGSATCMYNVAWNHLGSLNQHWERRRLDRESRHCVCVCAWYT